jgi:hypothetical protein
MGAGLTGNGAGLTGKASGLTGNGAGTNGAGDEEMIGMTFGSENVGMKDGNGGGV